MIRWGYGLVVLSGVALLGYAAVRLVALLLRTTGIGLFFKVVILAGVTGLALVLVGLVLERRKEVRDAVGDDPDDRGTGG